MFSLVTIINEKFLQPNGKGKITQHNDQKIKIWTDNWQGKLISNRHIKVCSKVVFWEMHIKKVWPGYIHTKMAKI